MVNIESRRNSQRSKFSLTALCLLLLLPAPALAVAMTTIEQQDIVNIHNSLRKGEGSSNMQILSWNPTLAVIAQNWSDACNYEHGQGVNSSTLGDLRLGQNLYVTSASTVNLTSATISWFNEKADYTYDNNSCASGKDCGHYTQVVWAQTTEVGCGYTLCPTLNSLGWSNAVLLVCNYAPAGNYIGKKPYLKGTACTQCSSGQFYCNNGLCDSSCSTSGANCVCSAACQNCATQTSNCRCQCGTGWTGVDCSAVCNDTDTLCNNGWYTTWCEPTHQYVLDSCPAMCSLCVAGTPAACSPTTVPSNPGVTGSVASSLTAGVTNPVTSGTAGVSTQLVTGSVTTTKSSSVTAGTQTSGASTSASSVTVPTTAVSESYPPRGTCLATKVKASLRRSPLMTAKVASIQAGDAFISLGIHRTTSDGRRWLKVMMMPNRSPVGWINANFVRPEKRRGKKRRCGRA